MSFFFTFFKKGKVILKNSLHSVTPTSTELIVNKTEMQRKPKNFLFLMNEKKNEKKTTFIPPNRLCHQRSVLFNKNKSVNEVDFFVAHFFLTPLI